VCIAAYETISAIKTLGIAPATTKIGLANLVYNIKRLIFLRRAVVTK
jgi:hypothetical protein